MAKIKPKSPEHRDATASAFANAQAHIEQETRLELKRKDLEQMSPAQLVDRYIWLEKGVVKDRLQQCKILREIRVKFGDDDRRFGEFLSQTLMSELNPKMITRMIQVADFFETKPIDGIAWTSALALAEPRNAPVAFQVYNEIAGRERRPVDVTHQIDAMMGRTKPVKVIPKPDKKSVEEPEKGSIEGEFKYIKEEPVKAPLAVSQQAVAEPATASSVFAIKAPVAPAMPIQSPAITLTDDMLNTFAEAVLKVLDGPSDDEQKRVLRECIRRIEQRSVTHFTKQPYVFKPTT